MKSEQLRDAIGYVDDKWLVMLEEEDATAAQRVSRREHRPFVAYEVKKLFGVRYLWVFLAVFLLINSVVAWVMAGKSAEAAEPSAMIADFFARYETEGDAMDAHYARLTAFRDEQNALLYDAMRNGLDYEPAVLPDVYSTDASFSDTDLFAVLYDTLDACAAYPATIDAVLARAEANLAEFRAMGLGEDSYAVRYQQRVIDLYTTARDAVTIEPVYTRGWDAYFAYDTVNVFLYLMLLLLGTVVFTQERQSGFQPILRTARFGRLRTACAKIMAALIVSGIFALLFTASTFAVYGMRIGFSTPYNVLQSLDTFILSPYLLSIGEYFLLTVGLRLLAVGFFTLVMLAVSVLLGDHTVVYLAGLGFLGLHLLAYFLPLFSGVEPIKCLNLLSVAAGNPLYIRYRALNLFGAVVGYLPFIVPALLLCGLVCAVLTAVYYSRVGCGRVDSRRLDLLLTAILTRAASVRLWMQRRPTVLPKRRMRTYSLSLFGAECFKTLISSRFVFVLILLLAIKIGYSADVYAPSNSYADAVFREYMTTLAGEVTAEKESYIREERARIDETLAQKTAMQQAYVAGEIDFDTYGAYMDDYNYAVSRTDILTLVEERAAYLQELAETRGIRGWFVYDTGWRTLFSSDADLFLYAAILLLLTGIFAAEYTSRSSSGAFIAILRSTKHGRARTFYAKLASAETIAFVLALLMGLIDALTVSRGYLLTAADAPLVSLPLFAGIHSTISIGAFTVLFFVLRLIGALLLALLVCALSELLCKYLPILGSTVAMTMLPALCAAFGLAAADRVNFLNLLAGTPLFLQTMRVEFLDGWPMLALWMLVWCVVIGAILVPAKKMFVK